MSYPELTNSTLDPQLVQVLQPILAFDDTVLNPTESSTSAEINSIRGTRVFRISTTENFAPWTDGNDGAILQIDSGVERLQIAPMPRSDSAVPNVIVRRNDHDDSTSWTKWYKISLGSAL